MCILSLSLFFSMAVSRTLVRAALLLALCCWIAASLPNPASVNCNGLNGSEVNLNAAAGVSTLCALPNGRVCEEWALLRGGCPADGVGPVFDSGDDAQHMLDLQNALD